MNDTSTTLTERGQTSVPSSLRRAARLKPGQHLRWQLISDTEFRVTVEPDQAVAGPMAALGYALRFQPGDRRSTDQIMRELREGEEV